MRLTDIETTSNNLVGLFKQLNKNQKEISIFDTLDARQKAIAVNIEDWMQGDTGKGASVEYITRLLQRQGELLANAGTIIRDWCTNQNRLIEEATVNFARFGQQFDDEVTFEQKQQRLWDNKTPGTNIEYYPNLNHGGNEEEEEGGEGPFYYF